MYKRLHEQLNDTARTVFHISAVLGLTIGFLDIAISFFTKQAGSTIFTSLIIPFAVTTGFFFLMYGILWFLVFSRLGRLLKLDATALAIALAVFFIAAFTLASLSGLLSPSLSLKELLKLFLLILISCIISLSAYLAVKAISLMPSIGDMIISFAHAIPFLIAEYILFAIVLPSSDWTLIGFFFAALVTVVLFHRVQQRTRTRIVLIVLITLVFLAPSFTLVTAGISHALKPAFHQTNHRVTHVILITVDTLREDFVSCYNNQEAPTQNIDRLATDGILFSKVISPAPWTLPSLASMMTGLSPSVHMTKGSASRLPDNLQTLSEYMRDQGYYTAAILSNQYLATPYNLSQGFLEYNAYPNKSIGDSFGMKLLKIIIPSKFRARVTTGDLTELAIEWLRSNHKKDFFLWIHYLDPHAPYAPPKEFLPSGNPPPTVGTYFDKIHDIRGGYFFPSYTEKEWIIKLYDSEVRYVDNYIGKLLETLKELNIYDDSLIILTSDHGEEFWEHGGYEHGHTLYNELLRVPLIIKLPQSGFKGRIDTIVQTHSIMPTILDICDINHDAKSLSVSSLTSLWRENPKAYIEQPIISSSPIYYEDREALIFDGLKYIHSLTTNREELYDLARDPEEQFSIAYVNQGALKKARDILREYDARAWKLRQYYQIDKGTQIELDEKTIQELRSLGYVK